MLNISKKHLYILSIENLLWLTIVAFISHNVGIGGRLQERSVAIIWCGHLGYWDVFFFFLSVFIDYFCSLLISYMFIMYIMYSGYYLPTPSLVPSPPTRRYPNHYQSFQKLFYWAANTVPLAEVFEGVSSAVQYSKMCQSVGVRLVEQPDPGRPVLNLLPWRAQSSAWNGLPDLRLIGRAWHGNTGPAQGRLRAEN